MTRVRVNSDNLPAAPGLNADNDFGCLSIRDGTGVVLTTPTSLTVIAGSPMVAGRSYGTTVSATNGTLTIVRPGDYEVHAEVNLMVAVNSQAIVVEVQKNDASFPAADGGGLQTSFTQAATAVNTAMPGLSRIVRLVTGDVLKTKISASTGNATIKDFNFYVRQVNDQPLTHE